MISTLTIKRMSSAQITIEHPDEWDATQVKRAAQNRAMDVANRASFWDADTKSTFGDVALGEDTRDPEDEYQPDPFELTEDDLDDEVVAEEPATPAAPAETSTEPQE